VKTPALLPVWICLACTCGVAGTVEVTAHGAAGDGVTNDTAAIQGAIDACAAGGGGDVVLPTGRYLSGSLTLKSGVRLVVTPEATLLGSTSMADYPGRRLISATDAAGVGITGGGTIDGQGNAFWERRPERGPAEAA
jgi:alpha-L-rhamnosidase